MPLFSSFLQALIFAGTNRGAGRFGTAHFGTRRFDADVSARGRFGTRLVGGAGDFAPPTFRDVFFWITLLCLHVGFLLWL